MTARRIKIKITISTMQYYILIIYFILFNISFVNPIRFVLKWKKGRSETATMSTGYIYGSNESIIASVTSLIAYPFSKTT